MSHKPKPHAVPPELIGWREFVRLPGLGIGHITAKIDTGARSAALHAEDIEVHGHKVRFRVMVNGRNHHCEATLRGQRRVKSTSGHSEARPVIETEVGIGHHLLSAEITLTDRTDMGVPMLIGRSAMRGRFIVHPGRTFLITKKKRKAK
jgi:hypothetical protein